MIAKAQKKQIDLYITGLDLSSAFDTINREELISILTKIVDKDALRMIRLLLSNTSLDIKMKGASTEPFDSNIGSPQGDAISGVLFNIYLEDALRRVRAELNKDNIHIEHDYTCSSSLPQEMIYADDSDYPITDTTKQQEIIAATYRVLPERNLKVNASKTEYTHIRRDRMAKRAQTGFSPWR